MNNFSKNYKVTRVINAQASGTGTTIGSSVDMEGFGSVIFVFALGAIGSGSPLGAVTVKAQQADALVSPETFSDIEGSAITYANDDDNQLAILEISSPTARYVRPVIERTGGASVIDGCIALQGHPSAAPVTHDASTVVSAEHHLAPSTGTA